MVRIMFTEVDFMGSLYEASRLHIETNMKLKSGGKKGHCGKLEIGLHLTSSISRHVCPEESYERFSF